MAIAHKEKEGEGGGRERGLVEDGKEGRKGITRNSSFTFSVQSQLLYRI